MYQKVLYFLNEDCSEVIEEGIIDSIKSAISKFKFKIKYSKRFKDLIKDINKFIKNNPKASDDELSKFAAKKIESFVGYFSFDSLYNLATMIRRADEETIEDLKQDEILLRLTALVMQSIKRLEDENVDKQEALILKKIAEYASIPWNYTKEKFGTAIDWANDGYALYEDEYEEE